MRVAIFASGNGTNFEALVDNQTLLSKGLKIETLVCDKPNAPVINKRNIPVFINQLENYKNRSEYEQAIVSYLRPLKIDYILLAGYMRVVTKTLLNEYRGRIINIHPSFLPSFSGLDAIERAFKSNEKQTGVTIHYINEGVDTGPIIRQERVPILESDTSETLEQRVHDKEHEMYPEVVLNLLQKFKLGGNNMKNALISVSDKAGIVEFAEGLISSGYSIISTGGTYKKLEENGLDVTEIDQVTGFPEILDGRVKTLHPKVHAGLLAKRDDTNHMETLNKMGIETIDLVCVNLYPFKETISKNNVVLADAIEQIDIGGPSMLRSASKNFKSVYVVTDKDDYSAVLENISKNTDDIKFRQQLAAKAFRHTAEYDGIISNYLTDISNDEFPESKTIPLEFKQSLRYGENSHQKAAFYKNSLTVDYSISSAKQIHGKELSFNNIRDADAAIRIVSDFDSPCVVALKHMNPCGIGTDPEDIYSAWKKAYEADTMSIFGGIVVVNREVDEKIATEMHKIFLEIVIAPSFSTKALEILEAKKNIRLLTLDFSKAKETDKFDYTSVLGGMLIQERDNVIDSLDDFEVVTEKQPTPEEKEALLFGQRVVKHVKSNAIVVNTTDMTLGVGAGQMNRIGSVKIAINQAQETNNEKTPFVMASDAFFPMDDCVEYAAQHGITAIIQPGGSIHDQDSIDMANKYGISMICTGRRHFKH